MIFHFHLCLVQSLLLYANNLFSMYFSTVWIFHERNFGENNMLQEKHIGHIVRETLVHRKKNTFFKSSRGVNIGKQYCWRKGFSIYIWKKVKGHNMKYLEYKSQNTVSIKVIFLCSYIPLLLTVILNSKNFLAQIDKQLKKFIYL